MDLVWINALCLRAPICMGRRLLPLSPGHSVVLHAWGSPFVAGGREPTLVDLAAAVWICSQPATAIVARFDDAQMQREFRRLGLGSRKLDFPAECALFETYLLEFQRLPDRWEGEPSGSEGSRAPWQFMLVRAAMERLGLSRDAAWNASILEVSSLLISDDPDVLSPEEIAERDAILQELK